MSEYDASSHGRRLTLKSCAVRGPEGPQGPSDGGNGKRGTRNNPISTAEMLNVALSYYRVRGTSNAPTFVYCQSTPLDADYYKSDGTPKPLEYNHDGTVAHSPWAIDCSSYIGLVLRGIPFNKSPYKDLRDDLTPSSDSDDGSDDTAEDPEEKRVSDGPDSPEKKPISSTAYNYIPANAARYGWATNPSDTMIPKDVGGDRSPARNAGQLGQMMEEAGMAIPILPGFPNLQPGDIIFWAKKDSKGNYVKPERYRQISHVAMVCSVKDPPDDAYTREYDNVTVSAFDADTALGYIAELYDGSNATYKVSCDAGESAWFIQKRLSSYTEGGSRIWVYGTKKPVGNLSSDLGTTASVTDNTKDASYQIVVYKWDAVKYPIKHTMLEVTTIPPYVLNRSLEKTYPDDVVLICRPDLGALNPDDFAGNIYAMLGVEDISDFYRPGLYYLTEDVTDGLPTGFSDGSGCLLRVEVAVTSKGRVKMVRHILQDVSAAETSIWINTMYFSTAVADPIADGGTWTGWTEYPALTS